MRSLLYYVAPLGAIIMGLALVFHWKVEGNFISWTNFFILVAIVEILFLRDDYESYSKSPSKLTKPIKEKS